MAIAIHDDIFAPDVTADPYSYFGRLREEDPIHWNEKYEIWIVTSYKDLTWVARRPELFSSEVRQRDHRPPFPPIAEEDRELYEYVKHQQAIRMIQQDPPKHTAMRRAVHGYFTPSSMEQWRPMIRDAIKDLLDDVEAKGRMEVMTEFATPLPLLVIAQLMGMPQQDRLFIREMAKKLIDLARPNKNRARTAAESHKELIQYLNPIVEERVKNPGDDLLSVVCQGERTGAFNREETISNALLLLLAGHETTINLICNGTLAFTRNPDQWDLLRESPAERTVRATEECLRYEPPVKGIERIAAQDLELGGKTVKYNDRLIWMIASANRDPRMFPDPDTFNIGRYPNPHVAFGSGIHHCLGAYLARLEGQEAFAALAERFPRLESLTDDVEYHAHLHGRSLKELHIGWN